MDFYILDIDIIIFIVNRIFSDNKIEDNKITFVNIVWAIPWSHLQN